MDSVAEHFDLLPSPAVDTDPREEGPPTVATNMKVGDDDVTG
jgi:hypothetical protein